MCIGYTKCADFISDARYNEKLAKDKKKGKIIIIIGVVLVIASFVVL